VRRAMRLRPLYALVSALLLTALPAPALTAAPAINDRWPHFSPDGSRIAFVSTRAGQRAPYVVDSDGSGLSSIPFAAPAWEFGSVAWISNSKLLYALYAPAQTGNADDGREIDSFVTATTAGLDVETLFAGINVQRPSMAPSQDRIAFEAERGSFAAQPNIDIEIVELATLTVHVLTHDDGTYIQASWSPDGNSIAFACETGGRSLQICTMATDGTTVRRLTGGSGSHQWPAWSPDSKRLAYFDETQTDGKIASTICIVNADGSDDHAITPHAGVARDETPSWSPDGRSIVFQTDRMGSGFRIAVVDAAGNGVRMVTK
jgi:Tol biopolymer transport system component